MNSHPHRVSHSPNLPPVLATGWRLANPLRKLFLPLVLLGLLLSVGTNDALAAPTVVGSQTAIATGPETITITKPTGLQVGDLMIVNLNNRGDNTAPSSVPAGWVQRLTYAQASPGRFVWIGYKVAVAADLSTANYAFTYSGNNDDMAGAISAFRGVDVASANGGIQVTGTPYVSDTASPIAPPSINTLSANSLVVFLAQVQVGSFGATSWRLGGAGGTVMTQLYQVNPTSIAGVGAAVLPQAAVGATGAGYKEATIGRSNGVLLSLKEGCNTTIGGANSACVGATAVVTPTSGGTWTSSNTSVATVTNAGVVTGVSPGVVTLSYVETSSGNFCSKPFTVNGVTIGGATSVAVGFQANVTPNSGGTWNSSNTGVATITNAGVVTGVAPGQTTLTYTANGCSNAISFSVYNLSNPVNSTLTSNRDADLYEGDKGEENYGSCNYMTAGGKAKDAQRDRSIVGFDLASIPSGAVITSAVLRLTNVNLLEFEATARDVSVHRLTSDWVEGSGACFPNGALNSATWDSKSTGSAWTAAGGDFDASALATISVAGIGSYDWTVTSQLQSWASNATPNYGFLVKYVDETVSALYKNFATREFATPASRPQLLLTYQVPCLATIGGATSTCPGTTANVTPATGGTWASNNTAVATVTNGGVVSGLTAGTVTLTYTETATGCVYTSSFTVLARPTLGGPSIVCQGFTANVTPATGGTWTSSNTGVATITDGGVVTGVASGSTTLTFTDSTTGCTNTKGFTVNALPALGGASAVCHGLTAVVTPTSGGTWSSNNTNVATVDNAGLVSGVAPGVVTLTFTNTATGCSNTKSFTVNALPVLGGATTVCQGLTANITPNTGGTWSSSSNSIATVSDAGMVTGNAPGVVTLTFTNSTTLCQSSKTFTVYAPPTLGGATAGCIGTPSNVSPSTGGTWSSSNSLIASVNNAGVITNSAIGTVTLTFTNTATGCSNTRSYTVNALPVLGGASSVCAGSTANVTPNTGGTWSSSNSAIASVSNAGLVTGVSGGSVTLTFTNTTTGCSASKSFTVNPSPVLGGSSSVELGSTTNVTPDSGGTWSSSDEGIATVTNAGLVTGVSLGEVTLTFTNTSTGCTATKTITVVPVANYLNSSMIDSLDQPDPTPEDHIETEPVFPISTSSLIVSVFQDTTGDGLGDVPLSGIVITLLDSNNNVVATVNTTVNGLYTFQDLPPGLYTVVQTVPSGNYTLYDNPVQATVVLGQTANADFVNSEYGRISGTVYANDGDDVMPGVLVSLLDAAGAPVLDDNNDPITTLTDISGYYVFDQIPVATYQVQQTVPSGFTAVDDVDGTDLTINGDITPIVILPGTVVTGQDFTNAQPGSITGTVTIDTTLDLAGDIPHVGVTVALLDQNGDPVLDGNSLPITTVTDSNGNYSFTNLDPGTYQIAQVVPSTYTAVSDSDGGIFTVVGDITPLVITQGSTAIANFTNQQLADIEVTKVASNPSPNVGDQVVFTITVKNNGPSATVADNVVIEDVGTGLIYVSDSPSKGTFTIDPGAPTNSYTGIWNVGTLALNESATLTIVASVSTAPGVTSFCNGVTASSSMGDQNPVNNDATVCVSPVRRSISGTVRIDTSGDANGDIPHQNVTVALLDASGNPVLDLSNNPITTTTDSNGDYTFADLPPGDYQVRQTVPATFIAVNDVDGGNRTIIGDITLITLTNAADIIDQDFVNTQLGSIAGNVSRDNTGDDLGDANLPGVLVVLRDSSGNFLLDSNNDLIVVATNGLGNYLFTNVPPGDYQVSVVPPLGLVAVNDVDGGDLYFNGDQVLISVLPGQAVTGQDFVLSQLVDVIATKNVSNSTPLVGSVVTFTINISNAGPATATGVVANDLLPSGYTLNSSNASQGSYNEFTGVWTIGNLALNANAQLVVTATVLTTGNYNNIVTATSNETDINLVNNTDNEEPDPQPIADLAVTKIVDNATPLVGTDVTFTMQVSNLGPSDATNVIANDLLPSGYTFVSASASQGDYVSGTGVWTIGNLANGGSVTLDVTATVLDSGVYNNIVTVTGDEPDPEPENNTDNEEPNPALSLISGTVFGDTNCDDLGDVGIPGVTVTLLNGLGATVTSMLTDANGEFSFSGLAAGNYTLVKIPLTGYIPVADEDGGNLNINGDQTPIVLASNNSSVTGQDFVDRFTDGFDPADDTDGDVFPAGQEYAFGGDPKSGNHLVLGYNYRAGMTIAKNTVTAGIDISYVRYATRGDVVVVPWVSHDPRNPANWTEVTASPVVTDNGDGTETVKWENIHDIDDNPLVDRNTGFVRLFVAPCDLDSSWTLVQGWDRSVIDGKRQTHGRNFSSMPVFTGYIDAATGSTIQTTTSSKGEDLSVYLTSGPARYYLELTDGPGEGHRFDLAGGEENSFTLNLASPNNTLAALPNGLQGSHYVIRRHETLGEIYLNNEWDAAVSVGSADQVLFYDSTGYTTYFDFPTNVWVRQGAGFGSQNGLIVPPGTGMLVVHAAPNDVNEMLQFGDLRYNNFKRPLYLGTTGLNLTALGYPFDASPAQLSMTIPNGFVASATPGNATQILNWVGDTVVNNTGWTTNFLLPTDANGSWRTQGNLSNITTNSPLFRHARATHVDVQQDKVDWTHLRPWNPAPWVQPAP